MTTRAIFLVAASSILVACAKETQPAADAVLPVRYAEVALADLATADMLTARGLTDL